MNQFIRRSAAVFIQGFSVLFMFNLCSFYSPKSDAALVVTPVDWSTQNSGSIGGVTVTLSSINTPFDELVTWFDLSSSYFSAAPLPAGTELVEYAADSNWTVTFSESIQDPLLYIGWWRGSHTFPTVDPPTNYIFDQSFEILSGLQDATVSGTTLTLPDAGGSDIPGFHSGIIQFAGSITSISVVSDAVTGDTQLMTFASPVPVPAAVWLFSSGLIGLFSIARSKKVE